MSKLIFINLPVTDLARATAFYESVGATKAERFCGETASCLVFSDAIHVMLLTHDFFHQFTPKQISDAHTHCEVLNCLGLPSREAVDEMVDAAVKAGGGLHPTPPQDHGFMYGRSFEDPDGHIWEVMWMDVEAFMAANAAQTAEVTPELA